MGKSSLLTMADLIYGPDYWEKILPVTFFTLWNWPRFYRNHEYQRYSYVFPAVVKAHWIHSRQFTCCLVVNLLYAMIHANASRSFISGEMCRKQKRIKICSWNRYGVIDSQGGRKCRTPMYVHTYTCLRNLSPAPTPANFSQSTCLFYIHIEDLSCQLMLWVKLYLDCSM